MDDFLTRVGVDLLGRVSGPMKLRLILQPLVAIVLAVRAGKRDAQAHKAPFLWALAFDARHRRELLREGWKDIGRVFFAAILLDVIYQIVELHLVYPGEAVLVALLLAVLPYLLVRAPVTRFAEWRKRSR